MILTREKLIQIQKEVHNCRVDLEEMQHGHVHESHKPTFKPNKNMGEGTPSRVEMDYRTDLITPLKTPYKKIKEILRGKGTLEQKKQEIDGVLAELKQTNYREIVNKHVYKISDLAIDKANTVLKRLEKDKAQEATDNRRKYEPDETTLLAPLLLQQYTNAEDILESVDYDIDQAYQRCRIIQQTRPDFKCNFEDYVDEAFVRAKTRADGMGWFGWYHSDEMAGIATLAIGVSVLGDIIADWVTMGDDRVCEECLDLEANSPYNILFWPSEPHFGCRCERQNERLASLE